MAKELVELKGLQKHKLTQNYYGRCICNNQGDAEKISSGIRAILGLASSAADIPEHDDSHCSLRCMGLHVHVQAHTQVSLPVQFVTHAKSYFHFLFCYYYIFPVKRNFSLEDFSLKIIYRKLKM